MVYANPSQDDRVIFVDRINTHINAARTEFTLALLDQYGASQQVDWTMLMYNIFLVGSDFSGFSDTLESSYIYAKLSDIEAVDPASADRIFTFSSPGEGSPFDYVLDGDKGQGCGMIVKAGQIIIEERLCQYAKFFAVISGFSGVSVGGSDEVDIQSVRVQIGGGGVLYPDNEADSYFKSNAADT